MLLLAGDTGQHGDGVLAHALGHPCKPARLFHLILSSFDSAVVQADIAQLVPGTAGLTRAVNKTGGWGDDSNARRTDTHQRQARGQAWRDQDAGDK
jgi:hypothetical protein